MHYIYIDMGYNQASTTKEDTMANLQIRIDDDLRNKAQEIANSMGLDLASAVRMFLCQIKFGNVSCGTQDNSFRLFAKKAKQYKIILCFFTGSSVFREGVYCK